jgi:hypothetical protein
MTDDPILQTLHELRRVDVSAVRARQLRDRCQRSLERQEAIRAARRDREGSPQLWTLRVVAGVWCGVYLFETIRQVTAVYGF